MQQKILSVGGSIIIPKTGFNISFFKNFRALILRHVKKGSCFILVVGGGATCRKYQEAARKVTELNDTDLDWLGIHSTVFNAQFVRMLFKEHAYPEVLRDPRKKVKTNKPILVAAGFEPGHSTDTDAVLLAKTYGAKEIINLSNIAYVYDKDPRKFKSAKKIETLDWASFRRDIVGNRWDPGRNVPFDPTASRFAQRFGLSVKFVKGTDLKEVEQAIFGRKFRGTTIG
ncbi:MAG: hypothetical protein A3C90_02245 [Candidatus Magasanikbacteria bacterium RIFCSPHIGHO2_02_FULL_51_14]|uniref:UMP kinase n=1 Tax=Candidatus Magasanikbacteria bacterium RIFCSPHIGHO2_02_FULL_51_14 TaxID=1798683 RepID=A0A1F6MQY0_9BACT|nr:MAG: hypothetical protein A3C90_02245 [Candidatus Magasanikbacteria bacterium RIFCSPHIGHO2_02_FULL_51_14]